MSSVSSHMLGYSDSYLREERKELTPGSLWFMGTRIPSGSKWNENEFRTILVLGWVCVNTGAFLVCPFLKHTSANALLAKPLAYNRALKHFPEPTQFQKQCGGQSHVQHQHPTSWAYLGKSIHFSASEGGFSLNVRQLLTQGQTSQMEDRNQRTSATVSHSFFDNFSKFSTV